MTDMTELLKALAQLAGPAVTGVFGWLINKRLKAAEQTQWHNRKIIEKRLELYDKLAPDLNAMYCFCTWVGDWKEISPERMIQMKRATDKAVHVYRHLFDEELFTAYDRFIHAVFQTYNGAGQDAKIRSTVVHTAHGDRAKDARYRWNDEWRALFLGDHAADPQTLTKLYIGMMERFRISLGLAQEDRREDRTGKGKERRHRRDEGEED